MMVALPQFGRLKTGAALIAMTLGLATSPAQAQSVRDFQLRPPSASPSQRAPGPVDSENPTIGPARPAPAPSPSASAQPRPVATPVAAPTRTPTVPTATRPAPGPQPRLLPQRAAPLPRQVQQAGVPASTFPSLTGTPAPAVTVAPSEAPLPVITPEPPVATPTPVETGFDPLGWLQRNWVWLAALLASAAALQIGAMWWRKREAREPVVDFEPPVVATKPEPPVQSEPAVETPAPAPAPAVQEGPLAITLEAVKLSATLLNTTLSYRITLSNLSPKPLGPVTISGDMIAAHASAPVEQQLGLDGAMLEHRHELPSLAPGESTSVKGDIRLALAAINPIKAGAAALFIPLARFQIAAQQAKGDPLFLARTFVVGEAPDAADGGLKPFRLDLGPRVYARIAQREVMATY